MTTQVDRRPIAHLNLTEGVIEFQTFGASPFAEELSRCRSITGGTFNREKRVWEYPATPRTAWALRNVWRDAGGFRADKAVVDLVQAGRLEADRHEEVQAMKEATDLPDLDHMKRSAWLHQRRAFYFLKDQQAGGMFIGMGGGKTFISIALLDEWQVSTALIECPLSVVNAWAGVQPTLVSAGRPSQFEQHSQRDWLIANLGTGTVAQKVQRAEQALTRGQAENRPVALVVNYESARMDPFHSWVLKRTWGAYICDESHRLKEPGGVTAKHAQTVAKRANRRLILTGTPMPHNPMDIYAQYRVVDPGVFGTNFAKFRAEYAIMGGYMNKQIVGFQHQERLQKKIYSVAIRVTKEELDKDLGLPEFTHVYRPVKLGTKAREHYEALAADFTAEVEGGNVTAANALVKLLRMAQVTSGYLPVERPDEDTREWVRVDDAKERELIEVLEDLPADEPIVISSRFARDLDIIHTVAKKLGRGSLELSGRRKDLEQWQMDEGKYPILALQEAAGGVGIDLTRARIHIFYAKGFSLGGYDQILARTHRPGQRRNVVYIHMNAEETVDTYVEELLTERRDVVEGILTLVKKGGGLKYAVQAVMERTDRI